MRKIKINPNALTTRYKIFLILLILSIGFLTTYSTTSIYNNDEEKLEDSPPNRWICKNNIHGIYNLKDRTQIINIDNVSNLHFTNACNYSNSMAPTITYDSLIIYITPEHNYDNLKIGDIIIFKQDGTSICHRIDGYAQTTQERAFRTKGDNNNACDTKLVYECDITGIVVGILY